MFTNIFKVSSSELELVYLIFVCDFSRRMDAEIIMKNIFEVFDSNNTGKIIPNELLWIFSMSLKGKGKYIIT
jgi:Ca2+-binding EF-hand superfamily protein